jgi:hypothetical protein
VFFHLLVSQLKKKSKVFVQRFNANKICPRVQILVFAFFFLSFRFFSFLFVSFRFFSFLFVSFQSFFFFFVYLICVVFVRSYTYGSNRAPLILFKRWKILKDDTVLSFVFVCIPL